MGITIRAASEADYEDICRLFRELDEIHHVAVPQVFQLAAMVDDLEPFRAW